MEWSDSWAQRILSGHARHWSFTFLCLAARNPGPIWCVLPRCGDAFFQRRTILRIRCSTFWPQLFVLTLLCRVGEATNPGPTESDVVLGAFNPSGLNGKAQYIVSQLAHRDIWASETRLCGQSLQHFRSGLHSCQKPVSLLQWWQDGAMLPRIQLLGLAFRQRARWFCKSLETMP